MRLCGVDQESHPEALGGSTIALTISVQRLDRPPWKHWNSTYKPLLVKSLSCIATCVLRTLWKRRLNMSFSSGPTVFGPVTSSGYVDEDASCGSSAKICLCDVDQKASYLFLSPDRGLLHLETCALCSSEACPASLPPSSLPSAMWHMFHVASPTDAKVIHLFFVIVVHCDKSLRFRVVKPSTFSYRALDVTRSVSEAMTVSLVVGDVCAASHAGQTPHFWFTSFRSEAGPPFFWAVNNSQPVVKKMSLSSFGDSIGALKTYFAVSESLDGLTKAEQRYVYSRPERL